MQNLSVVYFVNLYMFRAYLGPSSGGTTVCIQHLVLIILFRWLSVVLDGLESNSFRTTDTPLCNIRSAVLIMKPPTTQRLSITCTVFQAELYGISMAVDWIQSQGKKTSSYAINVDSKAALLAIANKHTTHSLDVASKLNTIELRNSTSVTFYWVKGHARLKGNERADYLAKTVASYNTTIAYDVIPIIRGKLLL